MIILNSIGLVSTPLALLGICWLTTKWVQINFILTSQDITKNQQWSLKDEPKMALECEKSMNWGVSTRRSFPAWNPGSSDGILILFYLAIVFFYTKVHRNQKLYLVKQEQVPEIESSRQSRSKSRVTRLSYTGSTVEGLVTDNQFYLIFLMNVVYTDLLALHTCFHPETIMFF